MASEESTPGRIVRDLRAFQGVMEPEFPITNFIQKMTSLFPREPDYCKSHLSEPVEPEHSLYLEAEAILGDIDESHYDEDDYGSWQPNENYSRLHRIVKGLRDIAYRKIPNPEYDADRCGEWRNKNVRTKIEWGMANPIERAIQEEERSVAVDLERRLITGE